MYITISLSLVALVALSSCGGGGGSTDSTPVLNLVAGYYSNVEGVSYDCGTHSGVTSSSGKFSFEANNACSFSQLPMSLYAV